MKKTFDELVKDRANERVQAKIKKFKLTVVQAAMDLFSGAQNFGAWRAEDLIKAQEFHAPIKETFTRMAGAHHKGWPPVLWSHEEELVAKELLATMDEMQRALLARSEPKPEDSSPEEAAPKQGEKIA